MALLALEMTLTQATPRRRDKTVPLALLFPLAEVAEDQVTGVPVVELQALREIRQINPAVLRWQAKAQTVALSKTTTLVAVVALEVVALALLRY